MNSKEIPLHSQLLLIDTYSSKYCVHLTTVIIKLINKMESLSLNVTISNSLFSLSFLLSVHKKSFIVKTLFMDIFLVIVIVIKNGYSLQKL